MKEAALRPSSIPLSGPKFQGAALISAVGGLNFVSPRTQAKPPERIESAEASTTSLVRQMFAPQGMRRHPDRSLHRQQHGSRAKSIHMQA